VEVNTVEEEINGRKVLISIVRDISKRKEIEMEYLSTKKEMAAKVSYLATHDILTELPNKAVLTKKLKDKLKRSENNPFAVFFIDIDRFKFINDTYGHSIGDILLIRVAERIKRLLCKEDLLCRYGGDEFVILVNGRENSAEFYKIASRIVNRCSRRFKIRGNELYISVSIGIAIYPDMGKNVDRLLKHASMAMYSAKKKGGNKYQVYVSKEDTQYFKRYSLFGYLNKALQKNEFLLYYQPQLELVTGEIKGVEALIRWFSPLGLINPGDFIPLAEDTGLIIPVGKWVTNTACKQNKKWQELGWIDLRMSINVSAKQFYQPCFVSTLESTLDDTNLDPESLSIEITESIAMEDFESASRIIRELKNLGISIAIDDFGTGYSSLNYLVNLDLDFLKIDRSLIKNLHTQGKKKNVVKGIINVAHNLGIKVIAEGVERQEELDFLKDHQCDLVQGFLIGYPLPVRQGVNCFKY
jgi:diguanylate cyclase (GGDEF)-like protein